MKDPVCGMSVDPATAKWSHEQEGVKHFFCSQSCQKKFAANPGRYLGPGAQMEAMGAPVEWAPMALKPRGHRKTAAEPVEASATTYICPMDPEVRSDKPGPCPKCGMALEPEIVTAKEIESPELADMTRRFQIGVALTIPVLSLIHI